MESPWSGSTMICNYDQDITGSEFYDAKGSNILKYWNSSKLIRFLSWRSGGNKESPYAEYCHAGANEAVFEFIDRPENSVLKQRLDPFIQESSFLERSKLDCLYWPHLSCITTEYRYLNNSKLRNVISVTSFLERFLGALLVLDYPTPKLKWYKNEASITKPLPSLDGKRPHLSLLQGDMGNPEATPSVVLDVNYDYSPRLHILVGVSGAGKTKALMDIGRENLSLYFDLKEESGFIAKLDKIILASPLSYTKTVDYAIFLFVAVRLVGLMLLKLHNEDANFEQLLLMQLNQNLKDRERLFNSVQALLEHNYETADNLKNVLHLASKVLLANTNQKKLCILFDNTQLLEHVGKDCFKFVTYHSEQGQLNVLQYMVANLLSYGHIFVTGTSLSITKLTCHESPSYYYFQKDLGACVLTRYFKHVESVDQCFQMVKQLFDVPNLTKEHAKLILDKLKGRPGFLTQLAEAASQMKEYQRQPTLPNEEILLQLVDDFYKYITVPEVQLQFDKVFMEPPPARVVKEMLLKNQHHLLAEVVACYHLKKCMSVETTTDLLANGLLDVKSCSPKYEHTIAEMILIPRRIYPITYYFSDGVLWVFDCIATDSEENISNRMVEICFTSTDLVGLNTSEEIENVVAEMHRAGTLRHLVRVHIILPSNPQGRSTSPITKTQIGTTDQYIETTILDITVYNLKDCQLFSREFSEQVISMYKKRKIGTRKSTRPKKKVKKF